ncbi:MAG: pentapeptide repeat-containing protein [Rhizobiaceae bacterium]|nr:pentapeptide repeat-containing protein [Rhizobiaceae bacterium]
MGQKSGQSPDVVAGAADATARAEALARQADDIPAARKALEDATSLSRGLWITFISFSAYLAIAAGSVTHVDLFLEYPVKLPLLNIDLPLIAFFWIAPVLLLIVHTYLLLNLKFLADNVRAWDGLVNQVLMPITDQVERRRISDGLRYQLPNFIVVQMLAAPSENRSGVVGSVLVATVLVTVIVAPIALLLLLQAQFLPYHSEAVTRLHRLVVIADLVLIWFFWPRIDQIVRVRDGVAVKEKRIKRGRAFKALSMSSAAVTFVVSVFVATFPGEPLHGNGIAALIDKVVPRIRVACDGGRSTLGQSCERLSFSGALFDGPVNEVTGYPISLFSNRLVLTNRDFVDLDETKLAEIETTRSLRGRNLERAILVNTDLRKADFTSARMIGADLSRARLQGARFGCDVVKTEREEDPNSTTYEQCVDLTKARFASAKLQGASLVGATLDGSSFENAEAQGASFRGAQMNGANLENASLTLADLSSSRLVGASLVGTDLRGARLFFSNLRGATFVQADLRGADMGTPLFLRFGIRLDLAMFLAADLRQANASPPRNLNRRHVVIDDVNTDGPAFASPDEFNAFSVQTLATIPDWAENALIKSRLDRLSPQAPFSREALDEWARGARSAIKIPTFEKGWAVSVWTDRLVALVKLACSVDSSPHVAERLILASGSSSEFETIGPFESSGPYQQSLARILLDETRCVGAARIGWRAEQQLLRWAEPGDCELQLPGETAKRPIEPYCFKGRKMYEYE